MPKLLRRCRSCSRALPSNARVGTLFCSDVCRANHRFDARWEDFDSRKQQRCEGCGEALPLFFSRADARYCSPRCRQRAFPERHRA
jgi:predicted nucleic acid-binding Zn ribbon protein